MVDHQMMSLLEPGSRLLLLAGPKGSLIPVTGGLILEPIHLRVTQCPSATANSPAPPWKLAGKSTMAGAGSPGLPAMRTAIAASLMLSGCSSPSTQVSEGRLIWAPLA